MMLILAIVIGLLSLVWGLLTYGANMMSDAPGTSMPYWPALVGFAIAILLGLWSYYEHVG